MYVSKRKQGCPGGLMDDDLVIESGWGPFLHVTPPLLLSLSYCLIFNKDKKNQQEKTLKVTSSQDNTVVSFMQAVAPVKPEKNSNAFELWPPPSRKQGNIFQCVC